MRAIVDLDQMRTFLAVAETGSFTHAANVVSRTQSAISMQMRLLEERFGKEIFLRESRGSRLTEDGQRLVDYARRIVRLSDETLAAFDETEQQGSVRLGIPTDYADRFLPEIFARFRLSNPLVEISVTSEISPTLMEMSLAGDLDIAIVTSGRAGSVPVSRREPLLWVGAEAHSVEQEEILPLALSVPSCVWRIAAIEALVAVGRKYRVVCSSGHPAAIWAAVLAGLAITVLPESACRPGMRVLTEGDGFPRLSMCEIGIIRSWRRPASAIVDKLAQHVVSALDNLSVPPVGVRV